MSTSSSPYVRIVTEEEAEPVLPPANERALVTGYEPDRFQKFAIAAIEAGENVLVTAKTGSGKTFVGEYQIAKSLHRGGRVFYTTPVKSLSNQKFHDLKKLFPSATVGIMTGDIKFQPDAQILVMTTEILRNLLFKRGTATESVGVTAMVSLEGLDAVIFDEVHYINDADRGHVWEECLMLLPASVHLVLLSATLSQPYGFARWLGELKKTKVWLISTQWRAVPLEHYIFDGEEEKTILVYDSREKFNAEAYRAWLTGAEAGVLAEQKYKDKVRAARRAGVEGPIGGKPRRKAFEAQLNTCLGWLDRTEALPAIVFVFSRAGCERLAGCVQADFLDSSDAAAAAHIWDFHLSRYRESLETSPQAHALRTLACRGIAYHHSGLQPFLKEILEILFSKGYIKVLFATETFAVGINMPTKTVIFTAVEKFAEGQIRPLRSAEYIQMAGRAGRRGKDTKGLVLHLPQRDPAPLAQFQQVLTGQAGKFCSRMTFHYDFLLKVLNEGPGAGSHGLRASDLIQKSYWRTLLEEEVVQIRKETARLEAEVAASGMANGLADEWKQDLGERLAIEERIATTQNAKKKQAQRELARWLEDHPESIWKPRLERYKATKKLEEELQAQRSVCATAEDTLADPEKAVPDLPRRLKLLEEFGFVEGGALSSRGRLASEVNEGHPFLLTELFLSLLTPGTPCHPLEDILAVLAVFLGEAAGRDDVEGNRQPADLEGVSDWARETIRFLQGRAQVYDRAEQRLGLPDDLKFWTLTTEWVEPIAAWLADETLTVGALAAQFGLFEGNVLKGLMKLASLLEEWQSLATLAEQPAMLRLVEDAKPKILRGVVLAESLYLRI